MLVIVFLHEKGLVTIAVVAAVTIVAADVAVDAAVAAATAVGRSLKKLVFGFERCGREGIYAPPNTCEVITFL